MHAILLLALWSPPEDSSWRLTVFDITRFSLLRSVPVPRASSLSPAGDLIAVYSGNDIRLFSVPSGRFLRKLVGHEQNVHDSGWSPDGRIFATSGYDGKVRTWETATGRPLAAIAAHKEYACSVAVSPDGKHVATGGSEDNLVRIFRVHGGSEVRTVPSPHGATYAMDFTGDGKTLVSSHADGSIAAWEWSSGRAPRLAIADAGFIETYAFSSDGLRMAIPADNGTIRILDCTTWREQVRLEGHKGGTSSLTFHRGGRFLASTNAGGRVRLWDVADGRLIKTIQTNVGASARVAFDRRGWTLVVTGNGGVIKILGNR